MLAVHCHTPQFSLLAEKEWYTWACRSPRLIGGEVNQILQAARDEIAMAIAWSHSMSNPLVNPAPFCCKPSFLVLMECCSFRLLFCIRRVGVARRVDLDM